MAVWQLDRMLDLDDQQQKLLRPELVQYREWLRAEVLPQLTQSLQHVKSLWDSQQYQQALLDFEQETERALYTTLATSWPRAAPLLAQLTPDNFAAYRSYVESRSDDWYADTLSDQAKQDERIEQLENWFGKLSSEQINLVRTYTGLQENERAVRIDNGKLRRQKFISLALSSDWQTLEKYVKTPRLMQTTAYRAWREQERRQLHALLSALIPALTQQQKQHVSDVLAEWIARFASVTQRNPDKIT